MTKCPEPEPVFVVVTDGGYSTTATEDGEGVVYLASPGGRCPATEFRLESLESNQVVFTNPTHDFPQRIEYRRKGDVLHAQISGTEDGEAKAIQWSWTLITTLSQSSGPLQRPKSPSLPEPS